MMAVASCHKYLLDHSNRILHSSEFKTTIGKDIVIPLVLEDGSIHFLN